MFRAHYFGNTVSRAVVVRISSARFISIQKIKETLQQFLGTNSKTQIPYSHVCQVGDPVLRGRAIKVNPEVIKTAEFQKVVKHLTNVMRTYNSFGLSGPQIGLPWQIFVVECTENHMKGVEQSVIKAQEISLVPTTVFINPELKVVDHTPITFYEGCESVRGFTAAVPRAYEVDITALNVTGKQFTWKARGWAARIVQHEYDHLQGRLYLDKMDLKTFHCAAWYKINKNNGKVHLSYWPSYWKK
ncbi:hypothetical protein PUN28_000483 [Cardiocondyla obscurior]|uniref:Peptide deformylase n=1 Tax=Cardiocondyla obscurior TaxID=286306 RepID=A0AAW2H043_9HYME